MDVLENILENILSGTVCKNWRKNVKEIDFYKFIWFRGEEI